MKESIFISCPTQNTTFAQKMAEALEGAGIPCWYAMRDFHPKEKCPPQLILDAIDKCHLFVVVLSMRATQSQQIQREVEAAWRKGKPIVAFKIDKAECPMWLENAMREAALIDVGDTTIEHGLRLITERVTAILRDTSKRISLRVNPKVS